MNIKELSNLGANVSVCVTLADLKEFVSEMMAEVAAKPQQAEERMLSADEVCEILHVSSNTLWRWNKSQYLCPVKIGRKSVYKLS
ncbi:MAG: helix-turn-helix domain-containing protein, partial [Prevotella sp.]|nr:helix-turn-helix domain-containing protein [Prevotella sp.]